MPVVNREIERQIVEEGRRQGKSDDFIKSAVLRYREKNQPTESTPAPVPDKPSTPVLPSAQTSPKPTYASAMRARNEGLKNVLLGVGKGALSTLRGATSLVEKGFQTITRQNLGKPTAAETVIPKSVVTPTNRAQKAGFAGEQIGEFFIPGGAATKVGKTIEGASALSKVPRLAKFLGLGTTALTEGSISAGQIAAQEGEVNKGTVGAGMTVGAFSGLSKLLGSATKRIPKGLWTSVLNRTAKMVEKNPKLEQQAAEAGLVGTRKNIASVAKQNIQKIETELDDLLVGSKGQIEGTKLSGYLEDLKNSYKSIPGEEAAVSTIENIQKEVAAKGVLNLSEANKLKRTIYEKIANSYGKGTLEIPAKTEAQKTLARGLKEEIEKIIPEAKTLNEKQAVYIQVKKAIERVLNQPRKGIAGTGIGWYDLMLGGIGLGATGGDYETALKLVVGKKLVESPAIRTSAAKLFQYFNDLSPTKKALFYNALKGLSAEGPNAIFKTKEIENTNKQNK